MQNIKDKRNKYKILVVELYGYTPNCKHTIKDYLNMVFTHFKTKKEALKYLERNLEIN